MNIYLLEIKRFLKENKKNIILGTLFFGVLLGGIITVLDQSNSEEEEQETEIEDSKKIFENNSRSAYFRFYIEKKDGSSLNNAATMNELFNMESLYEEILVETNIDIEEIKELAEEKKVPDFSPVKVKINDSNIYTAIFETGNNKENMILANYYYNYLLEEHFDLLENHKTYLLVEPEFVKDKEEQKNEISQSKNSKIELIKDNIINIITGFIFAIALSFGLLLLRELFVKKLNFIFGYTAEDFDDFIVYDKQFNNEKSVQYFVGTPNDAEKLILTEVGLDDDDKKLLFADSN